MLHDDIIVILDLDREISIEISPTPILNLDIDFWPETSIITNLELDTSVIIDLKSMGIESGSVPRRLYGKVARAILFTKAVLARKTTFGKSNFVITNNIQTIGTADIDPGNHNLVGIPITFTKSVSGGRKTTFGKTSLVIINNIQTQGINESDPADFYGEGLYGEDVYAGVTPQGSGASSFSTVIGFGATISGYVPIKETSVAEISLGSHDIPAIRTNHSIKVRARTISGSNGMIKAAVYEGAVNRSGDLISAPLSNALADYTLSIPDAAAATITDYSNLSIKIWGYDSSGNGLVFEIAEVYLELPIATGSISYGSVSRVTTFTKAVSGVINSKKTTTAEISFAPHGIPSVRTAHSIKVRARTVSGSNGVIKASLHDKNRSTGAQDLTGELITQPLTNVLDDYTLVILDSIAAAIIDYSNLAIKFFGFDYNGAGLVFEIADIYLELPVSSGNTTHYGSVSRVTTFNKAVSGIINSKRTTTAEISLASHGTPSVRTNHSIKVRARITSGSTGVLKAELYEGATLRSGATPLVTSSLTTSLVDYTLAIPDAAAATITSYSNLSIKFWGFDSAGNALVFEVSEIYLELPTT